MTLQNSVTVGEFFIFAVLILLVRGETYENVSSLRSALLASYDRDVVPISNQSEPLNINLTLYLYGIPDVDPVRGALTLALQIKSEWYDEKITWTPSEYGGVEQIFIPSSDVWTPYLTLANPIKFAKLDQTWMSVQYSSDGHANFLPGEVLECSCGFYMKFWPFDKHVCTLEIFPHGYPLNKVSLRVTDKIAITDLYKKNPEWNLLEDFITYDIDNSFGNAKVIFFIRLTRQPEFYMLAVIMPISGVAMLTCLVFLLPSESGERMGYSVTMTLALAVFLTITAADLPKTSDPIPIMCMYIMFCMMICMGAVVLVIFNLAIYHRRENEPIPGRYKQIIRIARCRSCKRRKVHGVTDTTRPNTPELVSQNKNNHLTKVYPARAEKGRDQDMVQEDVAKDEENYVTWKEVSYAIDRIVFYSLLTMTAIPTIIVLLYLAFASDFVSVKG